jgi:hypothetical protein
MRAVVKGTVVVRPQPGCVPSHAMRQ